MRLILCFYFFFICLSVGYSAGTPGSKSFLEKGNQFQELTSEVDSLAGHTIYKLTSGRDWNHFPTYHNRGVFSPDASFVIFTSWWTDRHESYLMRADLPSGKLTVLSVLPKSNNEGRFNGNNTTISADGKSVFAYTYLTLREVPTDGQRGDTVLTRFDNNNFSEYGHPASALNGKSLFISLRQFKLGSPSWTLLNISPTSPGFRVVTGEVGVSSIHMQPNPTQTNLILVVREEGRNLLGKPLIENYYKSPRMGILNLETLKITDLTEPGQKVGNLWVTHAVWNFDGSALYYEVGSHEDDAHEIGKVSVDGKIVWRKTFPVKGIATHVGAHPQKDWMVLESDKLYPEMPRHFRFLKFDQLDQATKEPKVETIALHQSDVSGNLQESHGHSTISPDGRWMNFGAATKTRSDVYVIDLFSKKEGK